MSLSLSSLRSGLERTAFVFVVAVIAAVGSERMFWYWSTSVVAHLSVGLFYAVAAAVTLWAIDRFAVSGWWSLWLATPLFALVVEGVITPVVYSGGPLVPIFPAWFALWHGVLAFGVLVIGIRSLLLARRTAALAGVSAGVGVFWGLWSTTLRLPENLEDPELLAANGGLEVLTPLSFATYALVFSAVLAVGHLALGWLWPSVFRPARRTQQTWSAILTLGAALWTVVYPWALPMFFAYGWLQIWGLRRHARAAIEPTLLARLAGPTPLASMPALALMPAMATATYAGIWELDPALSVIRAGMWTTIGVQTVGGLVISGIALRRAGRSRSGSSEQVIVAQPVEGCEVEVTRSGTNSWSAG